MLPSMVRGLKEKRIGGKGRPEQVTRFRKICRVCAKLFDKAATDPMRPLETGTCEGCSAMLDQGYIGLRSTDGYAFIKSASLADMAGQVIQIQPANFEQIRAQYNVEWKTIENPPSDN